MESDGRAMGTVQWFSRVKGYGFIRPDEQEEDVFVHYSVIRGEGYRNLNRGQRVEFIMEDTPKGPQATDVIGFEMEEGETEGSYVMEDTPKGPQATDVVGLEMGEGETEESYVMEDTPKGPQATDVVGLEMGEGETEESYV